jgi:hypothetical protein
MWYSDSKQPPQINYEQPIVATSLVTGEKLLLLPQIKTINFCVLGYNWFRIKTGEYNSCVCFPTVADAIEAYPPQHYRIENVQLSIQTKSGEQE